MLRYKEIKNSLLEEISRYRPGEKLLSRPMLCKQFDTTRATLDKAVSELIAEGFLGACKGSGTFVRGIVDNMAQAMVNIVVLVPNNLRKTYRMLVFSLENKLSEYGINIILCNTDDDPEKQRLSIQRLALSGIAGFIIVPAVIADYEKNFRSCSQLIETKIPFVFCYRGVDGVDAPLVTSNNFYGGYIAAKHLISQGYKHIGFVASRRFRTSIERYQGFTAALAETNTAADSALMVLGSPRDEYPEGYSDMRRILESNHPVDAIFCYNDRIAQGVASAITNAGLVISDDIGLIGYEDEDVFLTSNQRLTSINLKNAEIGDKAAELLWQKIQGKPQDELSHYVFQPELVIRASCLGPKDSL